MRPIAIDTETWLIAVGRLAPPVVCVSRSTSADDATLTHHSGALPSLAADLTAAANGEALIIGHNVAFDLTTIAANWPELLPLIFEAYERGAIYDTMIAEKLLDLARGDLGWFDDAETGKRKKKRYSLDAVWQSYGGQALDKGGDSWRLRYRELHEMPLVDWPEAASAYAKEDARVTWCVWREQQERAAKVRDRTPDVLQDLPRQTRAAFALQLMAAAGMLIDQGRVAEHRAEQSAKLLILSQKLKAYGFARSNGKLIEAAIKRAAKAAAQAQGVPLQKTPSGAISTAAEFVLRLNDQRLRDVVEYKRAEKKLSTYLDPLAAVTAAHPNINTLLESGRTSMFGITGVKGPSLQTLPGDLRDVFAPRPGNVYVTTDYATAELRSLGQVCLDLFGRSKFAEVFQRDTHADPHTYTAAMLRRVSIDEAQALKARGELPERKDAKVLNFGLPGGMGAKKLAASNAKKYFETDGAQGGLYEIDWLATQARNWKSRWGLAEFFAHVSRATENGFATIRQPRSNRYRGGCGYSDGANTYFQGLTADGAKNALWLIAKAIYLPGGALAGTRLVNFVHDETVLDAPRAYADEAARIVSSLMVEGMMWATPDVPAIAEPNASERWAK